MQMRFLKILIIVVMGSVFMPSCYYDNEEDLYPEAAPCDTTGVTYSAAIAPIMEANCNSCHNAVLPNAGVITDNYSDLKVIADNGQLRGATHHEQGYSPMPKNQAQLPECDLAKIRIWLDDGAPDN